MDERHLENLTQARAHAAELLSNDGDDCASFGAGFRVYREPSLARWLAAEIAGDLHAPTATPRTLPYAFKTPAAAPETVCLVPCSALLEGPSYQRLPHIVVALIRKRAVGRYRATKSLQDASARAGSVS